MPRQAHRLIFLLILAYCLVSASTVLAYPQNIILMIGDGMGREAVKAAGMYAGGQTGTLSFETFPFQGEVTTYSADNAVTDSAAAATAMATGHKVNNNVVGLATPGDGSELTTLLEYFKANGKRTGLVTTDIMTGATPAGFGAHETSRLNYGDIANDYFTQTRPNVLFGGGGSVYGVYPASAATAGYTVVTNRASMQALDTANTAYVSGQFGSESLPFEAVGVGALPHLSEMTRTALEILSNDPDGFFLMVEGAKIDYAGHTNHILRSVFETIEFSSAVAVAKNWAGRRGDTLIVVTADHETGGLIVTQNNGQGVLPDVAWTGDMDHTGVNVPLYAWGVNAHLFSGILNNTDFFSKITAPFCILKATLPAAGDTLAFRYPGGGADLTFPGDSFPGNVNLTLEPPSSFPPGLSGIPGIKATNIGIDITKDTSEQPRKKLTLELHYQDADMLGRDESRLLIARYDDSAARWIPLLSTPHPLENKVTVQTDHLSLFQLMESASEKAAPVLVYPNPFYPNRGQVQVNFSNLPASAMVRLYAISGEFIKELSSNTAGMAVWDGTTDSGHKAASGIYLGTAKGPGSKATFKVAIVR